MLQTSNTTNPVKTFLPTTRHVVVVTIFTLCLSWVLHALTKTPFFEVFGRIGFLGAALLFAYSAADKLRPRRLPRGAARLLAVILVAPMATLVTAVVTQGGNFLAYLGKTETLIGHIFMVVLALIFGTLFSLVAMRNERKQHERAERLQLELDKSTLERELLNSRLRLLQAQIEPHFLFNTLANIEALVASGSANAGPVLGHLIAYLRAAMPRLSDTDATLGTELQLVRAYLELMHLRMPDRLQFTIPNLVTLTQIRFPAMALLTLVENAVRHGIDPSINGGRIDLGGGHHDVASGKVTIWVSDTGVGMAETAQAGTGLSNLRTRLQGFYGGNAKLELHEHAPHGVRVELHFYLGESP